MLTCGGSAEVAADGGLLRLLPSLLPREPQAASVRCLGGGELSSGSAVLPSPAGVSVMGLQCMDDFVGWWVVCVGMCVGNGHAYTVSGVLRDSRLLLDSPAVLVIEHAKHGNVLTVQLLTGN